MSSQISTTQRPATAGIPSVADHVSALRQQEEDRLADAVEVLDKSLLAAKVLANARLSGATAADVVALNEQLLMVIGSMDCSDTGVGAPRGDDDVDGSDD